MLNGLVRSIGKPEPVNRLGGFQAIQKHFIDKPLPFSVRVSGIVDGIHILAVHLLVSDLDKTLYFFLALKLKLPVIGEERQFLQIPWLFHSRVIAGKIRIKVYQFIQVSDQGYHDIVIAFEPCITVFSLPLELLALPP